MPELDDQTLTSTRADPSTSDDPVESVVATLREHGLLERLLGREVGLVRLRHYVLLERIGVGGMGVVFAAYDEKLERKVALKLLRSAATPEAHLRLVREAQAMARLSHPNVVQIYEIGELEQLTFIVMEFVDGVTLGRWREQARRSQAEILAVFLAAGRGLVAAHDKGLVHRDFKPDNVMIGRDGRVLVMDFGIARADGAPLVPAPSTATIAGHTLDLTATGALMGTPAYMAPEQFCGEPTDVRTDQFSFCVALWEALYGARPFAGSTMVELSLAVTSGALAVPDKAEVPSWLHEVLVRGLAVAAADRHPSMAALLHALEHDPTQLRRLWLSGAAVVTLLTLGFVGVALDRRHDRAQTLAACEAEGQAIADDWTDARVDELAGVFEASAGWSSLRASMDTYARDWAELRTDICREARIDHTRTEASYQAVTACLDERRATFVGLVDAIAAADARIVSQATLAAASLPRLEACTDPASLAHQVAPPDGEQREQVIALRTRLHRAAALRLAGEHQAAAAQVVSVLDEARELGWRPLVAEAQLELAGARIELGEYPEARALIEQAFVDAIELGHDHVALESATTATSLFGYLLADQERGLYWGRVAAALIERMGLVGTTYEAELDTRIGHILWARGDLDGATASYTDALAIFEATLGPEHPTVADALTNVGYLDKDRGELDQAAARYTRALAIFEAALGSEHPSIATTLVYMGEIAGQRADHAHSLELFERALAIYERAYGPEHPAVANVLAYSGAAHQKLGQHERAFAEFSRALALNRVTFGPDHPSVGSISTGLGTALTGLGRDAEALDAHLEALRIQESTQTPDPSQLAIALDHVARVQQTLGHHADALATATRALALFESAQVRKPAAIAGALLLIGEANLALGRPTDARVAFERVVAAKPELATAERAAAGLAKAIAAE